MVKLKSSGVRIEQLPNHAPVAFTTHPQQAPVANATHPPIIITEDDEGRKKVSARSLYKSMRLTERFSAWIERMFKYGFEPDVDYTSDHTVHPQNGQLYLDYILTLACAKEIAMLQRTELGKQIRLYLLECERQIEKLALKATQPSLIQNEQIIKLVDKVGGLTKDIAGLKSEINQLKKTQSEFLQAKVIYPPTRTANLDFKTLDKRDRAMLGITSLINTSAFSRFTWAKFWDLFQHDFHVDLTKLKREEGESFLDVAARHGYIDKVLERINYTNS